MSLCVRQSGSICYRWPDWLESARCAICWPLPPLISDISSCFGFATPCAESSFFLFVVLLAHDAFVWLFGPEPLRLSRSLPIFGSVHQCRQSSVLRLCFSPSRLFLCCVVYCFQTTILRDNKHVTLSPRTSPPTRRAKHPW